MINNIHLIYATSSKYFLNKIIEEKNCYLAANTVISLRLRIITNSGRVA